MHMSQTGASSRSALEAEPQPAVDGFMVYLDAMER